MEKALAKMIIFKFWVEDKVEDHDDRLDDHDERLMMLEQANGNNLLYTWIAILVCWLVVPLIYVHVDANVTR